MKNNDPVAKRFNVMLAIHLSEVDLANTNLAAIKGPIRRKAEHHEIVAFWKKYILGAVEVGKVRLQRFADMSEAERGEIERIGRDPKGDS